MSDGPSETGPNIQVVFEYVDLALLDVDPKAAETPPLLRSCVEVLFACGVDPNKTRFVLTGDFVQSVRDRGEPGSELDANYDTRRSTGSVAGKTIRRPDSTVEVLLHAAMLGPSEDPESLARLALRTVIHEAQHVVIAQHDEAGGEHLSVPWARRNFLTAADQVIEEYRAEIVATRAAGASGWNNDDLIDLARTWMADIHRIAAVEYQAHLDVGRLSYEVLQETHTVWKLLAYVIAELEATGQALPASLENDALWALSVTPHWTEFRRRLAAVPASDERISRSDLDRLASDLADELQRWMLTLGFDFIDTDEGASFHIVDWSLIEMDRPGENTFNAAR